MSRHCLLFFILLLILEVCSSRCAATGPTDEECLACHSQKGLTSRRGDGRYIDPEQFQRSVHAHNGLGCKNCHYSITQIVQGKRIPHALGIEPKCAVCHQAVSRQYSRSLHAQLSKKTCCACHNPHYAVPLRQVAAEERKKMCVKCHDVIGTHRWLPQKELHFKYLECASCHDLNAEIGLVLSIVDKAQPEGRQVISYDRLAPYLEEEKNGLLGTLKANEKRRLSPEDVRAFVSKLRKDGISEAWLEVRILVLRPAHNFTDRGVQTRDCSLCHSQDAQFYSKLFLEVPEKDGDFRTIPVDRRILASLEHRAIIGDFYLLGESKIRRKDVDELWKMAQQIGFKWIDLIGVVIVAVSLIVVSLHAMVMFLTRKIRRLRVHEEIDSPPLAERIWHLIHGFFVIVLVLTGIQLRLPDMFPIFATFLNAVNLHNLSGAVVLIDYIFWIGYHLWRGQLRSRFFISPAGLLKQYAHVCHYYGYLIFIGERYPGEVGSKARFLPLEKSVFATVMFFLIPGQLVTGMLMYDVQKMMPLIDRLGGLRLTDAIHLVFGYLLASFMIVHTYFHTIRKYQ